MNARLLVAVTLLTGLVPAQPAAGPALDPGSFELLPLNDLERNKVMRQERARIGEVQALTQRIGKHEKDLEAARSKNAADAVGKLETELAAVREQRAQKLGEVVAAMRAYGVSDQVLALVAAAPQGPRRVERYAHTLVLEVPGLEGARRALVERVVRDVNAAYVALEVQRRRLELAGKQGSLGDEPLRALLRGLDQQLAQTDQRFWHLIDYVLTEDERFAVRELLPTRYARIANGPEHLYQLAGIEPQQTVQLRALLTELEAESAPDQALLRRAGERQRDASLTAEERRELRAASDAAQQRIDAAQERVVATVKQVLTPAQWRSYAAIPPSVSPNDRRQRARQLLEGIDLSPEQRARFQALEAEYAPVGEQIRAELQEMQRGTDDLGAEGPQMELQQMQQVAINARALVHQRVAMGRVFGEILTPDQVSAWVLGATSAPK